jgi:hypothetical protein
MDASNESTRVMELYASRFLPWTTTREKPPGPRAKTQATRTDPGSIETFMYFIYSCEEVEAVTVLSCLVSTPPPPPIVAAHPVWACDIPRHKGCVGRHDPRAGPSMAAS